MANTNVKRVKTSDLELKDRLVAIQRVTKVTKGGRHFRFAATSVSQPSWSLATRTVLWVTAWVRQTK